MSACCTTTGATCSGFLIRATDFFASHGIAVRQVIRDNALDYVRSQDPATALATLGVGHLANKPRCPGRNGKVERINRTVQTELAYRRILTSNTERTDAPCSVAQLQHSMAPPCHERNPDDGPTVMLVSAK